MEENMTKHLSEKIIYIGVLIILVSIELILLSFGNNVEYINSIYSLFALLVIISLFLYFKNKKKFTKKIASLIKEKSMKNQYQY
jgi:hypothetical protein